MTLNHCLTDDLIETLWIFAFLRYLRTNIVSVGNIHTHIYTAINHGPSKSLQFFIFKLENIFLFPEPKSSEIIEN